MSHPRVYRTPRGPVVEGDDRHGESAAGGHRALVSRVDRLEAEPVISVDDVDFTMSRPDRLRARLSESIWYFAEVEGDVPQNAADIEALLPLLHTHERRFLRVWAVQEAAHSAVFDRLGQLLGLQGLREPQSPSATVAFRALGVVAQLPWVHDVLKLVYLVRGAMHEHLTYDAYRHLSRQLEDLGESSLAHAITEPIRRQEAGHLGYYRLAAELHREQMSSEQLRLARTVSVNTYAPVGANRKSHRAPCGRVFASLVGARMDEVLAPVQAIGEAMLGDGRDALPPFVRRAMVRTLSQSGIPWAGGVATEDRMLGSSL